MPQETSPIERCLKDSGYTPPLRALPELLEALGSLEDTEAERVEQVLARAGGEAGSLALARLSGAPARHRQRLLALVKRVANEDLAERLLEPLLGALEDEDAKCRRIVLRALGNLAHPSAEAPLLARLPREALPEQRALVEALGKLGGEASLSALAALPRADADLARRVERAELLIARRAKRSSSESRLALDEPLVDRVRIAALCRSGLAELLAEELARFSPKLRSSSRVEVVHSGTLSELLTARTALSFALVIEVEQRRSRAPLERIARALAEPRTRRLLARWTKGPVRLRFEWNSGHQRAASWQLAKLLSTLAPDLSNDSRAPRWTAELSLSSPEILLIPRLDPDPRFDYREAAVEGASHPTIAAALARIAWARSGDVVWDPFVGSGLELVERARLGPYTRLIGSDVDPRALEAARANLTRAGVERFELVCADARSFTPTGVTTILSNPPMGRRVTRDGTTAELLESFLENAARVLAPRAGRGVWLSAFPERTERAGKSSGLALRSGPSVDLGGFTARVQVFTRATRRAT